MRKESIKIFVTHTPNKVSKKIEVPIFEHIIAGAYFQKDDTNLLRDNTGENISIKNKSYCELTTQYWAWKNTDYDYYGFCHYRRYFCFGKDKLNESQWGVVEYPFITNTAIRELHINEKDIRERINGYDFLIAKGIKTSQLGFKNVREHYKNAPELNINDFDIMMRVIFEKYPNIFPYAQKYAKGNISYPCNMFIMKKKIFREYSKFLFDVLGECEQVIDTSRYCVQSYRTIGHLAERLLGIYYTYLKANKHFKMGELQIALFKNTDELHEIVPLNDEAVPIVLAANDYYSPMLCTCLESLKENMNHNRIYDIAVFHTNISKYNQSKIKSILINTDNIRLQFVNIGSVVADYKLNAREHITTETFYRFLILDIMKNYKKVIYIDCDLVINNDIAKLYDIDIGNNLIAGTLDPDFIGQLNLKTSTTYKYSKEILKLKNPYEYVQAGVLIFNVLELRKKITVTELLEKADENKYRYSDQDILNMLCQGKITFLDPRWNHIFDCNWERVNNVVSWAPVSIYEQYMNAKKSPYIIHYAGFCKPWDEPSEEFGEVFWNYAKRTPYYEVLVYRMAKHIANDTVSFSQKEKLKLHSRIIYFFLPAGSTRRNKMRKLWYKIFRITKN